MNYSWITNPETIAIHGTFTSLVLAIHGKRRAKKVEKETLFATKDKFEIIEAKLTKPTTQRYKNGEHGLLILIREIRQRLERNPWQIRE